MSSAIGLNVINHLHFGHPEYIWAEFLPQILFMESIFGYLVVCIMSVAASLCACAYFIAH